MKIKSLLAAGLGCTALVVAGCGGSDDSTAASKPAAQPAATTPAPKPAATGAKVTATDLIACVKGRGFAAENFNARSITRASIKSVVDSQVDDVRVQKDDGNANGPEVHAFVVSSGDVAATADAIDSVDKKTERFGNVLISYGTVKSDFTGIESCVQG
jgi:hypothetical protein